MKNLMVNGLDMITWLCKFLIVTMFATVPFVKAQDLNQPITDAQRQQFDQMLVPVANIYNFIKYTLSFIGAIALLWGAGNIMFSGNDIRKRETGKVIVASAIVGLAITWAAPYAVNMLTA